MARSSRWSGAFPREINDANRTTFLIVTHDPHLATIQYTTGQHSAESDRNC